MRDRTHAAETWVKMTEMVVAGVVAGVVVVEMVVAETGLAETAAAETAAAETAAAEMVVAETVVAETAAAEMVVAETVVAEKVVAETVAAETAAAEMAVAGVVVVVVVVAAEVTQDGDATSLSTQTIPMVPTATEVPDGEEAAAAVPAAVVVVVAGDHHDPEMAMIPTDPQDGAETTTTTEAITPTTEGPNATAHETTTDARETATSMAMTDRNRRGIATVEPATIDTAAVVVVVIVVGATEEIEIEIEVATETENVIRVGRREAITSTLTKLWRRARSTGRRSNPWPSPFSHILPKPILKAVVNRKFNVENKGVGSIENERDSLRDMITKTFWNLFLDIISVV